MTTTSLADGALTVERLDDHTRYTATVEVHRAENLRILLADAETPQEIDAARAEIEEWTKRAVEHAVHLVRCRARDEHRAAHPEMEQSPHLRALLSVDYGVLDLDIDVSDFVVTAALKVSNA